MTERSASIHITKPQSLIITSSLPEMMRDAYAKAKRCRQRWYAARRTQPREAAVRIRQRMLKHQAIAYHLDKACRRCHEPG